MPLTIQCPTPACSKTLTAILSYTPLQTSWKKWEVPALSSSQQVAMLPSTTISLSAVMGSKRPGLQHQGRLGSHTAESYLSLSLRATMSMPHPAPNMTLLQHRGGQESVRLVCWQMLARQARLYKVVAWGRFSSWVNAPCIALMVPRMG